MWYASPPWFPHLLDRYEELAGSLASEHGTVIHGEYFSHNIVFQRRKRLSSRLGVRGTRVGEIDSASLVEGWDAEGSTAAVQAYRRARWPTGAPELFPRILNAARVYWQLLWLEQGEVDDRRFKELRAAGERLGLI